VIVSFVSIHTKRVPEVNLRVKRLIEDLFNLIALAGKKKEKKK